MEKSELFKVIQDKVLPIFQVYQETRNLKHLTRDDLKVLKDVWRQVAPTSYFNASCPDCVKTVLDHIQSWYQREFTRYQISHPEEITKQDIFNPTPKKRGRPKKSK